MADVVFSSKLALRTMPAQPPLKARSGTLPNEAYCHVCLTEEKHAIYAWRDHGEVLPGYPYSGMARMGCGGCGGSRCDAWCTPALAKEGQRVVFVHLFRKVVPVHLPCLARSCLFVDLAPSDKGKCVLDGTPIGLGEPRLLVVVPKHNGEADSPLLLRLHGARAFLSALWSELALQDFDVSLIAGVAQLPEGVRAWALEALKGKDGAAYPTEMYSATNKVPKYDYKGLHFKRNYPTACKTGKGKEGKHARLTDDGPPKKKGKQLELSFASPSSK